MEETNGIQNWDLVIRTILFSLGALLHGLGFTILYRSNMQLRNQRLILMNLSFAQFSFSINRLTSAICIDRYQQEKCRYITSFSDCIFAMSYKFFMLHLIIDKTCHVYFHLRYPTIFTQRVLKSLLCSVWFLNTLLGFGAVLLEIADAISFGSIYLFLLKLYLSADLLILITTILSFMYLVNKVRNIIRKDHEKSHRVSMRGQMKHSLILPVLMTSTYIIFNLTASVMVYHQVHTRVARFECMEVFGEGFHCPWNHI